MRDRQGKWMPSAQALACYCEEQLASNWCEAQINAQADVYSRSCTIRSCIT